MWPTLYVYNKNYILFLSVHVCFDMSTKFRGLELDIGTVPYSTSVVICLEKRLSIVLTKWKVWLRIQWKLQCRIDDICFYVLPDAFRSSICDLHQRLVQGLFVALKYFCQPTFRQLSLFGKKQEVRWLWARAFCAIPLPLIGQVCSPEVLFQPAFRQAPYWEEAGS